jgi:hypothetical protein
LLMTATIDPLTAAPTLMKEWHRNRSLLRKALRKALNRASVSL